MENTLVIRMDKESLRTLEVLFEGTEEDCEEWVEKNCELKGEYCWEQGYYYNDYPVYLEDVM